MNRENDEAGRRPSKEERRDERIRRSVEREVNKEVNREVNRKAYREARRENPERLHRFRDDGRLHRNGPDAPRSPRAPRQPRFDDERPRRAYNDGSRPRRDVVFHQPRPKVKTKLFTSKDDLVKYVNEIGDEGHQIDIFKIEDDLYKLVVVDRSPQVVELKDTKVIVEE